MKYCVKVIFLLTSLHIMPTALCAERPHSDDFYRRQAIGGCLPRATLAAQAKDREEASSSFEIKLASFYLEPPACEDSKY